MTNFFLIFSAVCSYKTTRNNRRLLDQVIKMLSRRLVCDEYNKAQGKHGDKSSFLWEYPVFQETYKGESCLLLRLLFALQTLIELRFHKQPNITVST